MTKTPKKHPWLNQYPVNIDWESEQPKKSMVDVFDQSVKKFGSKNFLSFMGKKYTYKEIGDMVDHMAKNLQDMGVKKGDKIGLSLPNSPFYVVSYYAAMKAGATVVNFNPLYPKDQMEELIKESDTKMMITLDLKDMGPVLEDIKKDKDSPLQTVVTAKISDALPWHKKALYKIGGLLGKTGQAKCPDSLSFKDLLKNNGKPKKVEINPEDDIAVLQFTGGTTGTPKAAMLSHANLTANTNQTGQWFTSMREGQEKFLAVLPFFHVFAMTVEMNMSMQYGAEIVMLPKFDIKETLDTIQKERPTVFAGVPTLYHAINTYPKLDKYDLTCLKTCIAGGAGLPKKTKEAFEKLTGCHLFEGYGLSETSPVATANPLDPKLQKLGSIGLPMPGTKIKIKDLEFPDKDCPIGVKGEICLKGPQVMKGYLNNKKATDEAMTKDGYFRTGDVGYMDEDGYTFICDRIKDMIIAGGYNIYPRKVEDAILKHPDIDEVIVAGVEDKYRGETVKAFIVAKEGKTVSDAALKEFLKDKLSKIEMPKIIEWRDELPKTMIGKPDKKALLAEEAAKAGKDFNQAAPKNDNKPPAKLVIHKQKKAQGPKR